MAADEVTVRAELEGDAERGLAGIEKQAHRTTGALNRLSRADASGPVNRLSSGVDRLRKRLRESDSTLGRFSDRLRTGIARGSEAAAKGLVALTAAAGFFGVNASADLELGAKQLEVVTGNAEAGLHVFEALKRLDPRMPFDIGQLTVMANMLGQNVTEAEALAKLVEDVGNVAALRPDRATDIARTVSQIQGAGQLYAEELNELVQAGASVGPALEQAFGISIGEFKRRAAAGEQFDANFFLETLFGLSAGRGEEIATSTLKGLLSGVRSRVMLELSDATSPLVQSIKSTLPVLEAGIGTLLQTVAPPLVALGGQLLGLITEGLPAVAPLLTALAGGASMLLRAMAPGLVALGPLSQELAVGVGELVRELVPVMPDLVALFLAMAEVLPISVRMLASITPLVGPVSRLAEALLSMGPVPEILAAGLLALAGYRILSGLASSALTFADSLFRVAAGQQAVNAASAGSAITGAGTAAKAAKGGRGLLSRALNVAGKVAIPVGVGMAVAEGIGDENPVARASRALGRATGLRDDTESEYQRRRRRDERIAAHNAAAVRQQLASYSSVDSHAMSVGQVTVVANTPEEFAGEMREYQRQRGERGMGPTARYEP